MQKFTSIIQKFDPNLWGYHFPVPTEIAEQFIEGDNKRVICKVRSQIEVSGMETPSVEIQCALLSFQGSWCILPNKNNRERLGVEIDDKIEIELEKDHSEFGMEMPEELEVLLA
ncbi:MAG: hypothetical protein ACJAWV_002031 [Flammeovirgaceae bacterium]|jgi:hypothetical protein